MATGSWWSDFPGLRQVFPSIMQASAEGQTTAQVWQTIRDATDIASASQLSIILGREATGAEIADASALMLKGLNIQAVNQARATAGQMVSAHAALSSADPNEQISGEMIGVPPWSVTSNTAGVQTQYRIHVKREIVFKGFTRVTRQEWASYNLSGPITSVADAIAQANRLFAAADYNTRTEISQILDYSIEAV